MGPREENESVGAPVMETEAPRRGRPPRQAAEQVERRRRQPGSLNRMVHSPLAIPEECKDPNYHYHWVNDVRGRVRALTVHDDYDIVTMEELEETARRNRSDFDIDRNAFAGNGGTVSLPVDTTKSGQEIRAILLKKRNDFYKADYEEGLDARQAMMEGRVFEGSTEGDSMGAGARKDMDNNADPEDRQWDGRGTYVPKSVTPSLPPMRRKGPVTRRSL